jgi:hypothetical protein
MSNKRARKQSRTIGEVCVGSGRIMLCDPCRADEASDWWDGYCERTDFDKSPDSVEINGTKDFPLASLQVPALVTDVMRWKPVMRKPLHGEYWLPKSESGFCFIPSSRSWGIIDSRGVTTPAGVEVGRLNYCICPNGRSLRKNNGPGVIRSEDVPECLIRQVHKARS